MALGLITPLIDPRNPITRLLILTAATALMADALRKLDIIKNKRWRVWITVGVVVLVGVIFGYASWPKPEVKAKWGVTNDNIFEKKVERAIITAPEGRPIKPSTPAAKKISPHSANPAPASVSPLVGAGATVTQQTNGSNSPNILGNNNQFSVNSLPIISYSPDGSRHELSPGVINLDQDTPQAKAFETMNSLLGQHNWSELAEVSEGEIKKTPEWLSPYLFSGIASIQTKDIDRAIERLEYFHKGAANNPEFKDWREKADSLRNAIRQDYNK